MPIVSIARALKTKNRLTGRIKELTEFISKWNSVVDGAERPGSVKSAYDELIQKTETLVQIKANIQIANGPVQTKIFELSELRSRKIFLQRLNTAQGAAPVGYAGDMCNYNSEMSGAFVTEEIKNLTKRIESLQDELDEFNATTNLTIPEVTD